MSQFLHRLDTGKCPFSISTLKQRVSRVRPPKIGAAKRAHYRKYGSDILAFGMKRYLSVPHLAISQQVPFFQEPMALWHPFCIVPRVERDQPLE
jgi:hypothetical protein